ncbi:mucin-5AC [Manduca sexta]|uniref:Chitin-binding type-2 domain-containing protein n=1 Tax=Manduca sexta TaxID=7130 RepID=A0A921YW60_MANSE|nr:mucin-5AC [Manduca sexta]XP_030021551.1 mucin-5AC [Manduca sexta]KAG6446415.1 hypothetical protein O3G_MSEX004457 [Manduca sexta]KAG6446416.1 hypothetical protein O3G_MSEX004457 [Manduca sexta]
MRRQARISAGGALVVRSASALQVWLWLLIFIFQNEFRISRSIQPGYLDFDNLPETNFTCAGKVIGGYYADLETSCQMFHVCTVGQQDEPMDIKFLCLNGTVFDQETRVCERVDEVDCTKSEKFYSLNLELYGSTAPPIIQPDQPKPTNEQPQTKSKHEQESDPSVDIASTTTNDKSQGPSQDVADSTEDPVQEIKKDVPKHPASTTSSPLTHNEELTIEYQEEDEADGEYEDYSHAPTTTQAPVTTTKKLFTTTTTTTTKRPPTTTVVYSSTVSRYQSPVPHLISSPSPVISPVLPSASASLPPSAPSAPSALLAPSVSSIPSLDPTLLSPQEFIYRHRGPGSEAISFQSFRPADGVYITHAPPHQFDHFQYESSRTAPRPAAPRPTPFVQRPQPAPFRPTTLDPRDQILRPGPTSQPSERQETSVNNRQQPYPSSLPAQRPLPFNPYYYDRKRSEDPEPENESSLSARSVAQVAVTERPPIKLKSPPRVIVTASASVSDSNGKRLNYTVGNVVKAVKPIVPINYDDYKESDLIFDPFFLDVPKLQKRRKTRSNRNRRIFTIPATTTVSPDLSSESPTVASSPVTSRATTTEGASTTPSHIVTTVTWNPNDYVDDNYEPHAYIPPVPPLAVLVPQHLNKLQTQEKQSVYKLVELRTPRDKSKAGRTEQPKPTSAPAAQTTSSQKEGADTAPLAPAPALAAVSAPAASPPPPPPLEASACASSRATDCRIRA